MAYLSLVEHVSNGSTTVYQVPFPYISTDYVKVYSINPAQPTVATVVAFTWQSANTIKLNVAVTSGWKVRIQRQTLGSSALVKFADVSMLGKKHLDLSQEQLLHLIQEAEDAAELAMNSLVTDHSKLTNLTGANQHSISTIIGLQTALDAKANLSAMQAALDLKADKTALESEASTRTQADANLQNQINNISMTGVPAHAARHAAGGNDPITPASIGALSTAHTNAAANPDPHPQYALWGSSGGSPGGTTDHRQLSHRDDAGAHPSTAITHGGQPLDGVLDAKANTTALTSGLAGKANTTHTHVIADVPGLQAALDAAGGGGGTNDHAALVNRDAADQHTIAAITGLPAALNAAAPLASPALTGTPTAPTASASTNSTQIATTGYVKAQGYLTSANLSAYAPTASPTLTGTPAAPTAATATNSTQIATTAYVKAQGYATLASPALSGTPTAPTAATATNSTQIATTAYVKAQGYVTSTDLSSYAPKASPALTGTPTAPTAAAATNNTQIATTAFAHSLITCGTADLTAGSSPLATGAIYLVYV